MQVSLTKRKSLPNAGVPGDSRVDKGLAFLPRNVTTWALSDAGAELRSILFWTPGLSNHSLTHDQTASDEPGETAFGHHRSKLSACLINTVASAIARPSRAALLTTCTKCRKGKRGTPDFFHEAPSKKRSAYIYTGTLYFALCAIFSRTSMYAHLNRDDCRGPLFVPQTPCKAPCVPSDAQINTPTASGGDAQRSIRLSSTIGCFGACCGAEGNVSCVYPAYAVFGGCGCHTGGRGVCWAAGCCQYGCWGCWEGVWCCCGGCVGCAATDAGVCGSEGW